MLAVWYQGSARRYWPRIALIYLSLYCPRISAQNWLPGRLIQQATIPNGFSRRLITAPGVRLYNSLPVVSPVDL